jgi:hypothetical protein
MKSANVIIFPTEVHIAHSSAMKEASIEGARALSMAGCGEDILQSPVIENLEKKQTSSRK